MASLSKFDLWSKKYGIPVSVLESWVKKVYNNSVYGNKECPPTTEELDDILFKNLK